MIEVEEGSIRDLDYFVEDFTTECTYDLLVAFAIKPDRTCDVHPPYCVSRLATCSVKAHPLTLSDGKPRPRARKMLLEFGIPLCSTEGGWELDVVVWESRLGCLFTPAKKSELVDSLIIWDWTAGDLVQARANPPAHSSGVSLSGRCSPSMFYS